MSKPEFYVLCLRPDCAPWVLTADRPMSRADCERAIRWQTAGGYGDADWLICRLNVVRTAFVTDDGRTLQPERGPYTAEAWERMSEAMKYRPMRWPAAEIIARERTYGPRGSNHVRPPGEAAETVPGELLTMGDGSQWFHAYNGSAPVKTRDAEA